MADEANKTSNARGCLKKLVLALKILVVLIFLIAAGVAGAFIMNKLDERNFQGERDKSGELQSRVDSLVSTVEDLEGKNNELVTENQNLKEQLKTAEQRRQDEANKNKLTYNTQELGKRLMTFQLDNPKTYFEFDKTFGSVKVVANPATFTSNVVADGIEISFANTTLTVVIEPWKISGRALETVEQYKVTTADGKEANITVLKETNDRYIINGTVVSGTAADSIKFLVSNTVAKDQKDLAVSQIRDILSSLEIDLKQL